MSESSTAFSKLADQARSRIDEISPMELSRAKPWPIVIDVREADEYVKGYLPGATHLSRGVLVGVRGSRRNPEPGLETGIRAVQTH